MPFLIRTPGLSPYLDTLQAMRDFTAARHPDTPDELWVLQHPPVFTTGLAGKPEHLLAPGDIQVVATERGGQVTYHGPGQAVVYVLADLRRRGWGVRELVQRIEQGVIDELAAYDVPAVRRAGAPGVYVDDAHATHGGAKIASLGLKISRGCSFHGVALNVAMDLSPFSRINPCGYAGLRVTDLRELRAADGAVPDTEAIGLSLAQRLAGHLDRP